MTFHVHVQTAFGTETISTITAEVLLLQTSGLQKVNEILKYLHSHYYHEILKYLHSHYYQSYYTHFARCADLIDTGECAKLNRVLTLKLFTW